MNFPESFSERLKRLRQMHGLSQLEVEAQCAFAGGTLARLESGQRKATERQCLVLAKVLRADVVAGTDLKIVPAPTPAWLDDFWAPRPTWVRPEWTLQRRMDSIQEIYSYSYGNALTVLQKNPHFSQLKVLFRDFWVDSNLEGLYWLRVAGEASPQWLAPLACNFRAHPVVCPYTATSWGDIPQPCLITEVPFRAVWFPQITVLLKGYRHRPDCLVYFGGGRWAVVQVDGDAHRDRFDAQRDLDLGVPVLRLKTDEVFSAGLLGKLSAYRNRCLELTAGP